MDEIMGFDDFSVVALGLIEPLATNPRKDFDVEEMARLVKSIELHGVIQPLVVRNSATVDGGFDIVAGERRWTAARAAGLEHVPCVIKDLDDLQVAELQLVENIDRHQLNPMEESAGVCRLVELGMPPGDVAGRVARSDDWVQLRLDLPKLPVRARVALGSGKLGLGGARQILKLADDERDDAAQVLMDLDGELTERTVADLLRSRYHEPRRRRAEWEKLKPELKKIFGASATAVDDVEASHEYVMAWGSGVGHWVPVGDEVGGMSEHPAESVISWGDLAASHEIGTLLVCAGGAVSLDHVVEVVDKRLVIDAERALRDQGKAHTLGPRKCQIEPEEDPVESFEELAVRCVADALMRSPDDEGLRIILSPVLHASEIETAADHMMGECV